MAKALKLVRFQLETLFIARCCYGCHKPLSFSEYMHSNSSKEIQELIKLWEQETIEIFCCKCYENKLKEEQLIKLLERIPSRICDRCKKQLQFKNIKDLRTINLRNLKTHEKTWTDEGKIIFCKSCKTEEMIEALEKQYFEFKRRGITVNELIKLGLNFGISFFINGKEITNLTQIIKETDKLEILIKNKKIINKLVKFFPDLRYGRF
jgi:hypothetical protein